MHTPPDPLARWTIASLGALIDGATPSWTRRRLIPKLVASGAIARAGRAYVGRRSDIERALATMGRAA